LQKHLFYVDNKLSIGHWLSPRLVCSSLTISGGTNGLSLFLRLYCIFHV